MVTVLRQLGEKARGRFVASPPTLATWSSPVASRTIMVLVRSAPEDVWLMSTRPASSRNASVIARPSAIHHGHGGTDASVWHGGHFALRWNATNLRCDRIPGGNAKPDRERSPDQRAASPTIDCPIWCPNSQSPRRLGGADRLHHNRIPAAAYRMLLY